MKKPLTKEEFRSKYGFNIPWDSRDRDMVIMGNLSDMQHEIENGIRTPEQLCQKLNVLKGYIIDTQGMTFLFDEIEAEEAKVKATNVSTVDADEDLMERPDRSSIYFDRIEDK